MYVSQKYWCAKKHGKENEYSAIKRVAPKNQSHQIWESRMAGKKEISLERQQFIQTEYWVIAVQNYSFWIDANMSKAYEKRSENNKERYRLETEKQMPRLWAKQEYRQSPKKKRPFGNKKI